MSSEYTGLEIAIIGMSCRVPGADNWSKYWDNLVNKVEAVKFHSREELAEVGVKENNINHPNYINASIVLEDKEFFDPLFFEYTQDEAKLLNPAHRIFHECVWEALEDAGCDPEKTDGLIGLFAGASEDLNWKIYSILANQEEIMDGFALGPIASKEYLTSLISYKLNLKGPSFFVNTACSTSLVAVTLACKSLLLGETKIALAGGVAINTEESYGYMYKDGGIFSKDGHCRVFDKDATGTIAGEGAGVVVLKLLKNAISDRDNIHAIIKGSAINNDGKRKVGFTAPSVEGQQNCIKMALRFSKVDPYSVSYVEAHGTGTRLGDPIELEALNSAFGNQRKSKCAIGSVKSNIGHLDTAAGVAGLIKTVLCLKYKKLVPSINFQKPNPEINFKDGPFYVNTEFIDWLRINDTPLRAGVSSFGIGGTNAHVILEEAPPINTNEKDQGQAPFILAFSSKTEKSLVNYLKAFKNFLYHNQTLDLSNVSYTLQQGRRHFNFRKSFVVENRQQLNDLFNPETFVNDVVKTENKNEKIIFVFPGEDSFYKNTGRDLYDNIPFFKTEMDSSLELLERLTGKNYKESIYPAINDEKTQSNAKLDLLSAFLFQYALARLINFWGIKPTFLMGNMIGEYVAACFGEVFDLRDCLCLLIEKESRIDARLEWVYVTIYCQESDAKKYLNESILISEVVSQNEVILKVSHKVIDDLIQKLDQKGIVNVKTGKVELNHCLSNSYFENQKDLTKIKLSLSKIPIISISGQVIGEEAYTSINYWLTPSRSWPETSYKAKLFSSDFTDEVIITFGSKVCLSQLLKYVGSGDQKSAISLLKPVNSSEKDCFYLATQIGNLWESGISINWTSFNDGKNNRRISLPTYSFEKNKHAFTGNNRNVYHDYKNKAQFNREEINKWFYRMQWKQSNLISINQKIINDELILIFGQKDNLSHKVKSFLSDQHISFVNIEFGPAFKNQNNHSYTIDPNNSNHYQMLFLELEQTKKKLSRIIHLWTYDEEFTGGTENIKFYQILGYKCLLEIVKNFSVSYKTSSLSIQVITNNLFDIANEGTVAAAKSTVLGAIKVIPVECKNIVCSLIDISAKDKTSISTLFAELQNNSPDREIAIRGKNRYIKYYENIELKFYQPGQSFKHKGTYLITGANGGVSVCLARYLAKEYKANLIMIGRSKKNLDLSNELVDLGSGVFYIQADVTNTIAIKSGIENAEKIYGKVNGVFHTAGLADFSGVILKRRNNNDDEIFAAKLQGTASIYSIFENRKLDFFINFSSISATLPPFGQVAYCAANNFQSVFAESRKNKSHFISIEWFPLKQIGMTARQNLHGYSESQQNNDDKFSIDAKEIIEVISRAIYLNIPVPLISTINFTRYHDFYMDRFNNPNEITPQNEIKPDFKLIKTIEDLKDVLIGIWEQFFGFQPIKPADDFFELGGDSLKALIVIKRIHQACNVEISLMDFFEVGTIDGLAEIILKVINPGIAGKKTIII